MESRQDLQPRHFLAWLLVQLGPLWALLQRCDVTLKPHLKVIDFKLLFDVRFPLFEWLPMVDFLQQREETISMLVMPWWGWSERRAFWHFGEEQCQQWLVPWLWMQPNWLHTHRLNNLSWLLVNMLYTVWCFVTYINCLVAGYFSENIALHFWASMISGLVTTAASMPVDIAKTRYFLNSSLT